MQVVRSVWQAPLPTESSTGGLFILTTVVLERVLLSGVGLEIILWPRLALNS